MPDLVPEAKDRRLEVSGVDPDTLPPLLQLKVDPY